MMSDIEMIAPTVQMASILHSRGVKPYLYLFSHKMMMDLKHDRVTNFTWLSNYSYHESELAFVFGAPVSRTAMKSVWHTSQGYSDADRYVSLNVMRLWTNFAKYG
jgi:carboxylesterase type B